MWLRLVVAGVVWACGGYAVAGVAQGHWVFVAAQGGTFAVVPGKTYSLDVDQALTNGIHHVAQVSAPASVVCQTGALGAPAAPVGTTPAWRCYRWDEWTNDSGPMGSDTVNQMRDWLVVALILGSFVVGFTIAGRVV